MKKAAHPLTPLPAAHLAALGLDIRARRRALRISATAAAEAAGVSRVTLHRIEKGEPSVTMGAWCSVMAAMGLHLQVQTPDDPAPGPAQRATCLPVRVALAEYPQLQALAWQVHGADALTPQEAYDIYERNARHLDQDAMTAQERALWQALQQVFGRGAARV